MSDSREKTGRPVYNPFFFVAEAFRGMKRHGVMTVASVLVLTSCLALLGAFGLLIRNINVNIGRLGLLNEIVVFVDASLDRDRVDDICDDIKALDNVSYVEYVSKDEGLESLKKTYSEYADLFDEIRENGDNPLSDSFVVTYSDTSKVYELEYSLRMIPGVTRINNRLDYAVKVENFKKGISAVFLWFFVLLFAVSIFVIFNTIKLAVHGRKNEIDVMRYIGATKGFIISPFIIEGAIIGTLSAGLAFGLIAIAYKYVVSRLTADLQIIEVIPFGSAVWLLLPAFAVIGIASGILASVFSLRKNLNN